MPYLHLPGVPKLCGRIPLVLWGMKNAEQSRTKEQYRALRQKGWAELWGQEVPRFNAASADERLQNVSLVRAVGVVFTESGPAAQREEVRRWLVGLLQDPGEKVRRYAMAALPKIGAGAGEEAELLALLQAAPAEREQKFLGRTLDKIGGTATLAALAAGAGGVLPAQTVQKVRASVARREQPSAIRFDRALTDSDGLRVHLRGRLGLEGFVRDELEATPNLMRIFRILDLGPGLVVLAPLAAFRLKDLYALRCFSSVSFVLGHVAEQAEGPMIEALARIITSPRALHLFQAFTEGSLRYRLDFVGRGHLRGAVRQLANRAFALCPEILNDAQSAPWTVQIHATAGGQSVELSPKVVPDPRFAYRQEDVPAASHPPLAACLARMAGRLQDEVVWDPFCGSGLELIETAFRGDVRVVCGSDRLAEAVEITRANFLASHARAGQTHFVCCDFRDYGRVPGIAPGTVSLVISNPPLGKRVPIPHIDRFFADIFGVAAEVLRPGGRLVFANPLRMDSPERSLRLESRQVVDFGGFDCNLEKYVKTAR